MGNTQKDRIHIHSLILLLTILVVIDGLVGCKQWPSPLPIMRRVQVADGEAGFYFDLSPDGQMVAYERAGKEIVISHLDGSDARVVSSSGPGVTVGNPRWSPDGTRLLYSWFDNAHPCEGQTVERAQLPGQAIPNGARPLPSWCAKTNVYHLETDESQTFPMVSRSVWSPDGERIAGMSATEGWLVVVDLLNGRIVFQSDARLLMLFIRSQFPRHHAWSPDGQYIAYAASEPSLPDQGRIMQVDQANTEIVLESANSANYAWSPDSQKLAYFKVQERGEGNCGTDLYLHVHVYSLDTGEDRVLTQLELPKEVHDWPTWSPDGRQIALSIRLPWEGARESPVWKNSLVIIDTDTGEYAAYEFSQEMVGWLRWSENSRKVYISGRSEILEVTLPSD